jgi:hypothetical protein
MLNMKTILFALIASINLIADSPNNAWQIGGKIHFEEQSADDYIGMTEINQIVRNTIKVFLNPAVDACAENAKAFIKKENNRVLLHHFEERSKPGIGEELHATLIYTRKQVDNGHETLLDIYGNLRFVDPTLPETDPPNVEQIATAYQKIINPDWKFLISGVDYIEGKKGGCIIAKLELDGRDEIVNTEGNPISGGFLHLTLVLIDPSVREELEPMISFLKQVLIGKKVKIGDKNGRPDLEFGVSGSPIRIRPT